MLNKINISKIKYLLLLLLIMVFISNNIYASAVIYQPSTEDKSDVIRQELNDIINGVVKPKAEEVYIFNDEVKPVKDPNFIDKKTMYQPSIAGEFGLPSGSLNNNTIKSTNNGLDYEVRYIRHTQSITKVEDYEFTYDYSVNKWTMHFVNEDKDSISPYSGMARNGFYKIGDKTYYFDNDGYMYVGILIDERDIVYNFNEEGELVFEGKLG